MAAASVATPPMAAASMQSLSQADATVKDLRTRMGKDVGLLSYLPCEKVRTAPFNNKGETGHPLPIRILFGKIKRKKSDFREVWALLHNKPGSNRPPEVRLKIFTRQGELQGPIALEEAMEQVSPAAAFICSKAKNNQFDRAHLSAIVRYYFILQKIQLPSPWPISDVFVSELKSACRVAKANAEGNLHQSKSFAPMNSKKPDMLPQATQSDDVYFASHRAIKSSRAASINLPHAASIHTDAKQKEEAAMQSTSKPTEKVTEDAKLTLAEALFGESADASLLPYKGTSRRVSSSRDAAPSPAEPPHEPAHIKPEDLVAFFRQNLAENEARDRRLAENKNKQVELEAELEDLREEADILTTAIHESKSERKRLCASLSKRDLVFIQLGQDLVQGGGKRLRFDDSDEE